MPFWNALGYVVKIRSVSIMNDSNLELVSFRHWFIKHNVIAIAGSYKPGDLAVFIKNWVKVPDGFNINTRKALCDKESEFRTAQENGNAQELIYTYSSISQLLSRSEYPCFRFLRKVNYIVHPIKSHKDPDVKSDGILVNIRHIPNIKPTKGLNCTKLLSLENGVKNG